MADSEVTRHNLNAHESAHQRASVRNSGGEDPRVSQRFNEARIVAGLSPSTTAADATLNWNSGEHAVHPGGPRDKAFTEEMGRVSGLGSPAERVGERSESSNSVRSVPNCSREASGVDEILRGGK